MFCLDWSSSILASLRNMAVVLASSLSVSVGGLALADGVKIIPPVDGGVKPSGSWSVARAPETSFSLAACAGSILPNYGPFTVTAQKPLRPPRERQASSSIACR
jgi:hypothetical protein